MATGNTVASIDNNEVDIFSLHVAVVPAKPQPFARSSSSSKHVTLKYFAEGTKQMAAQDVLISPSILSADFAKLADECQRIVELGADWLHIDVMDGHFVPNLTIGAPVVQSLRKHSKAFFDCHLMVTNPQQWIKDFAKAGADMFTFHLEAVADPAQLSQTEPHPAVVGMAQQVRAAGMKVGVALKPATPAELLLPYLKQGLLDMVLVLTVQPGFGGQKFMADAVQKCKVLRQQFPSLLIEVDGGITAETAVTAAEAGANVLVAGSAIFGASDPQQVMKDMRQAYENSNQKAL